MHVSNAIRLAAVTLLLVTPVAVAHAATPEAACRSAKNKAAGAYAACREKAEAALATSGNAIKHGAAIGKCESKLSATWTKAEATAASKGASCPDGAPTHPEFKAVVDACTDNVAGALAGGTLTYCGNAVKDGSEACDGADLGGTTCASFGFAGGTLGCTAGCALDASACQPIVCGNGALDAGEQCDQNALGGQTCTGLGFAFGSLACGANCILDTTGCWSPPRFDDNGDGTITDHETGLMWEKKADLDGVPINCASAGVCPDPHDADGEYTWTDDTVPSAAPTGTAFTVFLAQLNAGGGFAGHTDWRLPTLAEIHALVDYADATSPLILPPFDGSCTASCTIATCNCTTPARHWTNTSVASNPLDAWAVDPGTGEVLWDTKDATYNVRAVRTGP